MISLRSSPFAGAFQQFVDSLRTKCLICSPYISAGPIDRMLASIEKRDLQNSLRVKVLTDVSLGNLVQSSTDVSALIQLMERVQHVSVRYLPRIHAKVYVSGDEFALVTSANFTDGGAFTNFEYGVALEDQAYIKTIAADIERYAALGGTLSLRRLKELDTRVTELRAAIREEQRSIKMKLRTTEILKRETEDQLLRSRVEGRSIYSVFRDTILYLLASGPMATVELHKRIQGIHPDLCDDSLDRVIDGEHFGKLWKHQVRTAQQDLKKVNLIAYDAARHLWACSSPAQGNTRSDKAVSPT
jgi:hypothetical protein